MQVVPFESEAEIFWLHNHKTNAWSISRPSIILAAEKLGFCLFRNELYRTNQYIIEKSNEREFQDALLSTINTAIDREKIINTYESFMQKNGRYTISRLPIISRDHFMNDTKTSCFKFFKNMYIEITPDNILYNTYDKLPKNKFILKSKISSRDYVEQTTGKYIDFISKAVDWQRHEQNIKSIIGYLCHEFKDETTGYIIVLTEQCHDPKDGGGSGKNLFCNLLGLITSYHSKNGNQVKFDEKFFQSWNGQRIMGISDVPKTFHFDFLKEPSTGTFILKKLFKDEIEIPVEDGPKFIVQTNYSYETKDGGLKRRIIPVEFTNFFTSARGVDLYYGCHFPNGWNDDDWNNFHTVIIHSIQEWLGSNRKLYPADLTTTGKIKQFEQMFGPNTTEFISERFDGWVESQFIKTKDLQAQLNEYHQANQTPQIYRSSPKRFNQAIRYYAKMNGYVCNTNTSHRFDNEIGPVKSYEFVTATSSL